jgi:hypothetical protein
VDHVDAPLVIEVHSELHHTPQNERGDERPPGIICTIGSGGLAKATRNDDRHLNKGAV